MVEGVQQEPVLVGTFFMAAEEYLPPTAPGADHRVHGVDAGLGSPRRAKMLTTESPCRTSARHGGPGPHV